MQIRSIGEVEIPACSWGLPAGDRVSFFVALNVHPPASKKEDTENTHGSRCVWGYSRVSMYAYVCDARICTYVYVYVRVLFFPRH